MWVTHTSLAAAAAPSHHSSQAHLEVDGRRGILWLYSDNARLHFRRRAEIVPPHLNEAETATVGQDQQTVSANIRGCTLTFMRWSTRANSWVLMDSLQYSLSPGGATSRMANSLWNISTAHLNKYITTLKYILVKVRLKHYFCLFVEPEERPMQQKFEDKWWWNLHN